MTQESIPPYLKPLLLTWQGTWGHGVAVAGQRGQGLTVAHRGAVPSPGAWQPRQACRSRESEAGMHRQGHHQHGLPSPSQAAD